MDIENKDQYNSDLRLCLNYFDGLFPQLSVVLTCAFPSSSLLLSWIMFQYTGSTSKGMLVFILVSLPAIYQIMLKFWMTKKPYEIYSS